MINSTTTLDVFDLLLKLYVDIYFKVYGAVIPTGIGIYRLMDCSFQPSKG